MNPGPFANIDFEALTFEPTQAHKDLVDLINSRATPWPYQRAIMESTPTGHIKVLQEPDPKRFNAYLGSVEFNDQTVVHIYVGDNVSATDVAQIVAQAPPGAHFVVHKGAGSAQVTKPPSLVDALDRLSTSLMLTLRTQEEFAAACLAVPAPTKSNQPYGPVKATRKGKVRRW